MDKTNYELTNRLNDFIDLALYKNIISTSRFLNPYEQSLAVGMLKTVIGIKHNIFGGYENSERNIIVICPENRYVEPSNYLALVKVEFSKYDTKYLNHRMILGSALSLGIKRDGIGDIFLGEDAAYIVATKKMAEYIDNNLLNVAHANVSTTYIDNTASINLKLKDPITIKGTIASLRIDSILALALNVSRVKACDLIKNQMVYVNWQLVAKPTQLIDEGQIITIRKKGRVILKCIGNNSRKNRIWVELQIII